MNYILYANSLLLPSDSKTDEMDSSRGYMMVPFAETMRRSKMMTFPHSTLELFPSWPYNHATVLKVSLHLHHHQNLRLHHLLYIDHIDIHSLGRAWPSLSPSRTEYEDDWEEESEATNKAHVDSERSQIAHSSDPLTDVENDAESDDGSETTDVDECGTGQVRVAFQNVHKTDRIGREEPKGDESKANEEGRPSILSWVVACKPEKNGANQGHEATWDQVESLYFGVTLASSLRPPVGKFVGQQTRD